MALFGTRQHPKGPSGPWERHELNLSGTRVVLQAPPHNHELIEDISEPSKTRNLYADNTFGRRRSRDEAEPPGLGLLYKDWVFRGIPLIDGVIADVKFQMMVYRFVEFASLFRSRRLECAIERYIYNSPDRTRVSGASRLRWRVVSLNGHEWVNYEVNCPPYINNAEAVVLSIWQLPISDEHLLTVYFRQIIRAKDTRLPEVFAELTDKVMQSVRVTLSEDARHQKSAVEQQYPWEKSNGLLPPYAFEEIVELNEWDMFCAVNEEFGEQLNYEAKDEETQKRLKQQAAHAKAIKQAILASHLRFEALEAEDYQRHLASQQSEAKA